MNKQFEEWFEHSEIHFELYKADNDCRFDMAQLPFSMQWGVYLEFFDSNRIYIGKDACEFNTYWVCKYEEDKEDVFEDLTQQEAIKKAFEILEG